MNLSFLGNKKSSFALSFLFLLGALATSLTESTHTDLFVFIPASILFFFAGLKLSDKQNQILIAVTLIVVFSCSAFLFLTYKEVS